MLKHSVWEYFATVFRLWKMHVSGWILALVAIGLTIAAATVADDASRSAKVVKLSAWLSGSAAIWVMFVAQYDAWKEEREARTKAEHSAGHFTGPEVWLSFQDTPGVVSRFVVENRSKEVDASMVLLDPVETSRYRVESKLVPLLRCSAIPVALTTRMTDKSQNISSVDVDLEAMLRDSSADLNCSLEFMVRYADHWGRRFRRRATVEVSRLRVARGNLPDIVNHAIESDDE